MAFPPDDVAILLASTGRMCAVCQRLHGVQIHHIVPRADGGSDDITNAIPLCPNCHDAVHRASSGLGLTRNYTAAELRQHLRRTMAMAAARPPAGGASGVSGSPMVGALPPAPAPVLPRLFEVPHSPNPFFAGREGDLDRLGRALLGGAARCTITGAAGLGKTQLAAEYAHATGATIDVVWWVRAEDQEVLVTDLAALADALGLPGATSPDLAGRLNALRGWLLSASARWLLVFDNALSAGAVSPHLPPPGAGQVIITSQDPAWERVAAVLPLAPIGHRASVEFLRERIGGGAAEPLDRVAEALGGHPMALEHVASFARESRMPISELADLLTTGELSATDEGVLGHPEPLEAVWDRVIGRLSSTAPDAVEVLAAASLMAPEALPVSLIGRAASDGTWESARVHRALRALSRVSLVEVSVDTASMHRLLAAHLRRELIPGRPEQLTNVFGALESLMPVDPEDPAGWPEYSRLLAHVTAAAERDGTPGPSAAAVLVAFGRFLNARALHRDARRLLNRAARLGRTVDSAADEALGRAVLARVHRNLGDYRHALEQAERAASLCSDAVPGAVRVECRTVLGRVLHDLGRLSDAEDQLRLAADDAVGDPAADRIRTIATNHLARVLRDRGGSGRLDEARQLLEWALRTDRGTFGDNHPRTAWTLDNLGTVETARGQVPRAVELLELALKIEHRVNGPDHPRAAWTLTNLAAAHQAAGQSGEARRLLEEALRCEIVAYGPDNPRTRSTARKLRELPAAPDF